VSVNNFKISEACNSKNTGGRDSDSVFEFPPSLPQTSQAIPESKERLSV
jgi:hypothetical protein